MTSDCPFSPNKQRALSEGSQIFERWGKGTRWGTMFPPESQGLGKDPPPFSTSLPNVLKFPVNKNLCVCMCVCVSRGLSLGWVSCLPQQQHQQQAHKEQGPTLPAGEESPTTTTPQHSTARSGRQAGAASNVLQYRRQNQSERSALPSHTSLKIQRKSTSPNSSCSSTLPSSLPGYLSFYLLGSPLPLAQPVEALAGLQPALGLVFLAHCLYRPPPPPPRPPINSPACLARPRSQLPGSCLILLWLRGAPSRGGGGERREVGGSTMALP